MPIMVRLLFLLHRYLGIGLGLIVSLWCLSGFVMMYVQFPELTQEEQLAGLDELDLSLCCTTPTDFSDIAIDRFRVEMMGGAPVLRLSDRFGQYVIDLTDGEYLVEVGSHDAVQIADTFASNQGIAADVELLGLIEMDQWTVYGGLNPNRPLYHFAATDAAETEWYVSAVHGEVIQMTTEWERFWNWLGSVPHWLYPTLLRQNTGLWVQFIIWLSVLGLFLTAIGIYIGLRQYKTRRNGRKSPYRGVTLWHHYAGLIFGALTLTWLFSGLLSVNPWGAFEGRGFGLEIARIRGGELSYFDAADVLSGLDTSALPSGTVRLEGSILQGVPYLVARNRDGDKNRVDHRRFRKAPLSDKDFASIVESIRPEATIAQQGWLHEGDAYYYDHHDKRSFPVYRVRYEDGERIYLDGVSGELTFAADSDRQWSRWLFLGLHRGDFFALMRARPLWDLILWPLMLGVTIGALTGTWIGFKRLTR